MMGGVVMKASVAVLLLLGGCSQNGAANLVQVEEPVVPNEPLANVRDFGAKGDGQTDDSAAFDAAVKALPLTGGTVLVPAGTYMLRAIHTNPLHVIDLSNTRNVTIAGQGSEATILRMAPTSYHSAIHIILIQRSSGITLKDLTLDGNRQHILYADEHSHGIQIESSADVRIEGVHFQNSGGDGVRLFGSAAVGSWAERIWVENSFFQDNARNGISIQRAARNVVIRGNTFERISDQTISAEPTGNGAPTDILVEGNVIRHASKNMAVALAGIGPHAVLKRLTFRNNRLENAAAHFLWTDSLVVEGNVILGDAYHSPMRLEDVSEATVFDNDLRGEAQEGIGTLQILNDDGDLPSRITLRDNRIEIGPGLSGIYVRDPWKDITISGNEVQGSGGGIGISFDNILVNGTRRAGISVVNNNVENFKTGIAFISRGDPYSNVEIRSNSIGHDQGSTYETIGILFMGTGPYQTFAQLLSNIMGSEIRTHVRVTNN
jgi:hypothetical protein